MYLMFHSALQPVILALLLAAALLLTGCGYTLSFKGDVTATSNLQEDPFSLATSSRTTSSTESITSSGEDGLPVPGVPAPTP